VTVFSGSSRWLERTRPAALLDRARERFWRLRNDYVPVEQLTWPLDPSELQDVRVEWPSAYHWPPARTWLDPIRLGLAQHVPVVIADIPQPTFPVVVFVVRIGEARHEIAVDYSDYAEIDELWTERALVYFKMQYASDGYDLAGLAPGGYLPYDRDLSSILGTLRRRGAPPRRSVVYGRFSPNNDIRRAAAALLESQRRFDYVGGLSLRGYGAYLSGAVQSAVCVDLPGRGPLCFRLIDYLATGCCVVALRHDAVLPVPLVDDVHIAYVDSVDELVPRCEDLLADPARASALGRGAQEYFDRYLERRQLAAYHLTEILRRAHASA
jgi:glycosyltransferase involved in cell wall biosynthesis